MAVLLGKMANSESNAGMGVNIVLNRLLAGCAGVLIGAAAHAGSAAALPLRVLVDTGTEMPMADIRNGVMVGGMHHDVGAALAHRMDRRAVYVALPRKRIALALERGQGDVLCMYVPEWLPGRFQWSQAFFPSEEVVVSRRGVPAPRSLADLAGRQIGTVLGYAYPELEHVLGGNFVRTDGPSSHSNLRKLALGRIDHAVTMSFFLDYRRKQGDQLDLHAPLPLKHYRTQCAVSEHGHVSVDEVNRAVAQMLRDGSLNKILARYK